jgi:multidrug efflux pump subunit AcrA (membrane-fusion protein)
MAPTLLALALLAGCGSSAPIAKPERPDNRFAVATAVVGTRELTPETTVPARFEAAETARCTARVAGPVVRVLVGEGKVVKAGDPLAELDSVRLRIAVASAEAAVLKAQAAAEEARKLVARREALAKADLTTAEDLDNAKSRAVQTAADLASGASTTLAAQTQTAVTSPTTLAAAASAAGVPSTAVAATPATVSVVITVRAASAASAANIAAALSPANVTAISTALAAAGVTNSGVTITVAMVAEVPSSSISGQDDKDLLALLVLLVIPIACAAYFGGKYLERRRAAKAQQESKAYTVDAVAAESA